MISARQEVSLAEANRLDVYFVALGKDAQSAGLLWLKKIRKSGLRAESDLLGRSLKAQMREAFRQLSRLAVILGEDELRQHIFNVKILDEGRQVSIPMDELIPFLIQGQKLQG